MSMTRDEIEKLTDADVDRYIAEKVMGWIDMKLPAKYLGDEILIRKIPDALGQCYFPHRDLNQAIEAAEKVGLTLGDDDDLVSYRFVLLWCLGKWASGWLNEDAEGLQRWRFGGCAPTPALAVCRAVIAAWEARK